MAALTLTTFGGVNGVATATVNTASASDTMTYTANAGQMLEMDNTTGGSLTLNIVGTGVSAAYPISGLPTTVDLTAGYSVVVAAGVKKVLNLDKIKPYLLSSGTSGTITLSGAATLKITVYA